jgi:hypothetical protein
LALPNGIGEHYQHIFVGTTVVEFIARTKTLRQTRPQHYFDLWQVCNVALGVLRMTGPTASGDALKIWWPAKNQAQNEMLGLRTGAKWGTLFKDNPEQAVFAITTSHCLRLGQQITCRVPLSWDYRIHKAFRTWYSRTTSSQPFHRCMPLLSRILSPEQMPRSKKSSVN